MRPGSRLDRDLVIMPRVRGYTALPVLATTRGHAIDAHGHDIDLISRATDIERPGLWVTDDAGELLDILHATGRYHPGWRFQATGAEPSARREDGRVAEAKMTLRRFTFEAPDANGRRHKRMHLVHVAPEMVSGTVFALREYALALTEWCSEQDIPVPTSLTGLSASLLRDSRFWPKPRGRVPRATNDTVRARLPGVYSESGLTSKQSTPLFRNLTSVDLTSAYHATAATIKVPDTTNLYAWGHYNRPEQAPVWIDKNDEDFADALSEHGLYALRISTRARNERWLLPALRATTDTVYLWSSEIPTALEQGLVIDGIVAGWTSPVHDEGLQRYAKWAQAELAINRDKPWLKVALITAYGLLGAQTQDITCHIGPRGQELNYVGPRVYTGRSYTLTDIAPATANVTALGVIQADIRTRMLVLARELEATDCHVTHVHADALHVKGDLPLLGPRVHAQPLTRLFYVDDNSWISDQTEHLPGRHGKRRAQEHRRRLHAISRLSSHPQNFLDSRSTACV